MPVHRLVHIYFVDLLTVYATESSGTFVTAGGLAKVFADGPALTTAIIDRVPGSAMDWDCKHVAMSDR